MRIWRICKAKYAATAFDGEGALRAGGRWNSRGNAVAYTSDSLALAALELLAHILSTELAPPQLVAIPADLPDELAGPAVDAEDLPEDWRRPTGHPELRALGDQWLTDCRSVALRVPSAVISVEENILLNPEHVEFGRVEIGEPRTFQLDSRLMVT